MNFSRHDFEIQMAAGDPPLTLPPSDSLVKQPGFSNTACASSNAHDIPMPMVNAISIQSIRSQTLF